jgi:Fic family protein
MAWCDHISSDAPGVLLATDDGVPAYVPNALPRGLPLPAHVHRLVATAHGRLGMLRGIGVLAKNPALFVHGLQTTEAAASSRIEGTVTTNAEALAQQVIRVEADREADAREVTNYLQALRQGVHALGQGRRLSRAILLELHQTLLRDVRGQRTQPGRFRDVQNFVGLSGRIKEARFVPPPALHVPTCIEQLHTYLEEPGDDDPIVRAALVHYQFETIHPFEDGNGRIGRLLSALQTIQEGLQQQPLLYLSSRLEADRQEYYDRLLRVSLQNDFVGWVEFFVRSMTASAEETADKIRRLVETIRGFEDKLTGCPTAGPVRLLKKLEENPFLTVKEATTFLGVSPGAAADAVSVLEARGIVARADYRIRAQGRGRPPILYFSPELVKIFE